VEIITFLYLSFCNKGIQLLIVVVQKTIVPNLIFDLRTCVKRSFFIFKCNKKNRSLGVVFGSWGHEPRGSWVMVRENTNHRRRE